MLSLIKVKLCLAIRNTQNNVLKLAIESEQQKLDGLFYLYTTIEYA